MSVRDLEAEGVMPSPASSYGSAEFSIMSSMIDMQGRVKRLEEVVASLCAKQRAQVTEVKGFAIPEKERREMCAHDEALCQKVAGEGE